MQKYLNFKVLNVNFIQNISIMCFPGTACVNLSPPPQNVFLLHFHFSFEKSSTLRIVSSVGLPFAVFMFWLVLAHIKIGKFLKTSSEHCFYRKNSTNKKQNLPNHIIPKKVPKKHIIKFFFVCICRK